VRLFFALDLPPACKRAIADWRDRALSADGRSVPPANFHLTLAFLGDVAPARLEQLLDSVDAEPVPRLATLHLDRVGYWPRSGIFWLGPGPGAGSEGLASLAERLGRCGQRVGARRDRRRFTPHVTLYRDCRQPPPAPAAAPDIACGCEAVTLFQSLRGSGGGVYYEPVAEWSAA
jgi:2'-5' RNA ligase